MTLIKSAAWTIFLLATLAIPGLARPYAAPPLPRREQIQRANLIVHAEVSQITHSKNRFGKAMVRFRVLETLRGSADVGATFEMSYSEGTVCPAPPVFHQGEKRILLFQTTDPTNPTGPESSWCGSFAGDSEGLATLRRELHSACSFLIEPDAVKRKIMQRDWMIARVRGYSGSPVGARPAALDQLAACDHPTYETLYREKQKLAARGDAAAHRWLDAADIPLDLSVDLNDEQQGAVRSAILEERKAGSPHPRAGFLIRRMDAKGRTRNN